MIALVTGAAGFIGSNLVDRLLSDGYGVVGYDDLSTGREEFLEDARKNPRFSFERGDLLDSRRLHSAMDGIDVVFHLAANADVRFGPRHPRRDLEQNTIATWHVLEAMRASGVERIAFASTASVYGDTKTVPTPEDCPFPLANSLYGASKLAAEAMIQAYCESFGLQAYIFRFVSILGPRYTHGHVVDFYAQLRDHPQRLDVLGNGRQRKSYLDVSDCVEGILCALTHSAARVNVFNLGTDEYCELTDSIGTIVEHLNAAPQISYSGGDRGWIGDSPFIFLDCGRIRAFGWRPRHSIRGALDRTLHYLDHNDWILPVAAQRNAR